MSGQAGWFPTDPLPPFVATRIGYGQPCGCIDYMDNKPGYAYPMDADEWWPCADHAERLRRIITLPDSTERTP